MADFWHQFGSDLQLAADGDLLLAHSADETLQRVLRRLMTIPGNYIWHLGYGAGLPAMIGQPADAARIAGIARGQMLQEAGVARTPPPTATAVSDGTGSVFLSITYTDANSGAQQVATFKV